MKLDDYVNQSAPAGDQRDDATAVPDLLNCLSRAAVDTTASYIQAGLDMKERMAVRLGDSLWYVAALVRRLKLSLSTIARDTLQAGSAATFDEYVNALPALLYANDEPLVLLNELSRAAIEVTGYVQAGADAAQVSRGLGKTFSLLAAVARRLELSLSQIAQGNLTRTRRLFGSSLEAPKFFDDHYDADERLPRVVSLRISEFERSGLPTVRMAVKTTDNVWLPIGSPLNDNAHHHDDYRFHDVLHLAYMAILGWSPVMRALFGLKRKSKPDVDRVEDGARATLLEEALTGFVYEAASDSHFFENTTQLDRHLLLAVKRLTRGLEVSVRTYSEWNRAILEGYRAFRGITKAHVSMQAKARTDGGVTLGTIHVNMDERKIDFGPGATERNPAVALKATS